MSVSRVLTPLKPLRLRAEVIHGFGRGSRQLGFPTANMRIRWDAATDATEATQLSMEEHEVLEFAKSAKTGIYCAFGYVEGVSRHSVHKVAMSMGWNPTFTDVKAKTIEPWILHDFAGDFYGRYLRLLVVGYIRPEVRFESVEELVAEIRADGSFCNKVLDNPELAPFQNDAFLRPWTAQADAKPSALQPRPTSASTWSGLAVSSCLREALRAAPPPKPGFVRLLLVRHGETAANEQGVLSGGASDSALTELGHAQASRLARELGEHWEESVGLAPLALVGSSPLRRAESSADAIAGRFPAAARQTIDDLREMGYGTLEGCRIADSRGEMAAVAQRWRAGDTAARVGGFSGESPEDLAARVLRALREVLGSWRDCTVLLVTHSWVNKLLIAVATPGVGLPRMLDVPQRNCAVNLLDFRGGDPGDLAADFQVLGVDLLAGESGRL